MWETLYCVITHVTDSVPPNFHILCQVSEDGGFCPLPHGQVQLDATCVNHPEREIQISSTIIFTQVTHLGTVSSVYNYHETDGARGHRHGADWKRKLNLKLWIAISDTQYRREDYRSTPDLQICTERKTLECSTAVSNSSL